MSMKDSFEQLKDFNIEDVDIERIGVWPWPIKVFLCAILIGLIFTAAYFLSVKDLKINLVALQAQEQTLRTTFERRSFEAANLDAYKAQMEEMKVTFEALLSRLPAKTEIPGLLEDLAARANESGLNNINISFQPDVAAEYYIEVPITITAEGGYHDIGGFVSGVAGMPRIVTLHNFSVNSSKDNRALKMTISAKTYRYKSPEGSAQ
jgi:type IV pilus assembly protein PilO